MVSKNLLNRYWINAIDYAILEIVKNNLKNLRESLKQRSIPYYRITERGSFEGKFLDIYSYDPIEKPDIFYFKEGEVPVSLTGFGTTTYFETFEEELKKRGIEPPEDLAERLQNIVDEIIRKLKEKLEEYGSDTVLYKTPVGYMFEPDAREYLKRFGESPEDVYKIHVYSKEKVVRALGELLEELNNTERKIKNKLNKYETEIMKNKDLAETHVSLKERYKSIFHWMRGILQCFLSFFKSFFKL